MKCNHYTLAKVVLLVLVVLVLSSSASAQSFWSEGSWYPDATGGVPAVSEIPWATLTHVDMVGAANPGSGGSITYPGDYATNANALVAAAHTHGVKVMFELTDSGGFDAAMIGSCAGPSAMHTFLNNIATAMSTYGFDGIFVDYEANGYNSQFGVFMGCLRTNFPAPKLIEWFVGITYQVGQFGAGGSATCGPGSNWNVSTATILAIANHTDHVAMSTYDLGNPGNGFETYSFFNSALYSAVFGTYGNTASVDWATQVAEACGIAASKLSISIPFYGDLYTINTAPYQVVNGSSAVYQFYYQLLNTTYNLTNPAFDVTGHVPWSATTSVSSSQCGGSTCPAGYITWENTKSITDKINYVKTNAMGGWMLWVMGMDYNAGSMPLLTAVGQANVRIPPSPSAPGPLTIISF